jgi:hypothetical protein
MLNASLLSGIIALAPQAEAKPVGCITGHARRKQYNKQQQELKAQQQRQRQAQ